MLPYKLKLGKLVTQLIHNQKEKLAFVTEKILKNALLFAEQHRSIPDGDIRIETLCRKFLDSIVVSN